MTTYEEGMAWLEAHGFDEAETDWWTHFGGKIDVRIVTLASGAIMWGARIDDTEEFNSDPESALALLSDRFDRIRVSAEEAMQAIAEVTT